ncbi:hypothetical protein Taro_044057 [Colocasia esculenta]|uniref:Uncharacterized protein n=1 Tax=Colocasia esculenta TaxID=4460 RepID=A0A843X4Y2_COLES|nr:hypothetical protein [Colocasia esculenta]
MESADYSPVTPPLSKEHLPRNCHQPVPNGAGGVGSYSSNSLLAATATRAGWPPPQSSPASAAARRRPRPWTPRCGRAPCGRRRRIGLGSCPGSSAMPVTRRGSEWSRMSPASTSPSGHFPAACASSSASASSMVVIDSFTSSHRCDLIPRESWCSWIRTTQVQAQKGWLVSRLRRLDKDPSKRGRDKMLETLFVEKAYEEVVHDVCEKAIEAEEKITLTNNHISVLQPTVSISG